MEGSVWNIINCCTYRHCLLASIYILQAKPLLFVRAAKNCIWTKSLTNWFRSFIRHTKRSHSQTELSCCPSTISCMPPVLEFKAPKSSPSPPLFGSYWSHFPTKLSFEGTHTHPLSFSMDSDYTNCRSPTWKSSCKMSSEEPVTSYKTFAMCSCSSGDRSWARYAFCEWHVLWAMFQLLLFVWTL